jgi:integrase
LNTKTKRQDITVEVPDHVARHVRWYRRHVLPRLAADANGYFFVTKQGSMKGQETLTHQIIKTIARDIGIQMTPHQFRHFAATSYLEAHPEDFETARSILGHAWSKTTRIYAGSASRRAGRTYNDFLFRQREQLKLKQRPPKKPRR